VRQQPRAARYGSTQLSRCEAVSPARYNALYHAADRQGDPTIRQDDCNRCAQVVRKASELIGPGARADSRQPADPCRGIAYTD